MCVCACAWSKAGKPVYEPWHTTEKAEGERTGKEAVTIMTVHINHGSSAVIPFLTLLSDAPRHKRGRYFDQGPSESESTEQKLESLITRVGEKVWV